MPRRNDNFKTSVFYHVYNRGFNKMLIFPERCNCVRFDYKIPFYSSKTGVFVKDYALMGNHFHLLLKQLPGGSVSKFMQKLQQSYATYYNLKYRRKGPLFDSRFKAKSVEDREYYLEIQKYIAMNPIKVWIRSGENFSCVGYPPELK